MLVRDMIISCAVPKFVARVPLALQKYQKRVYRRLYLHPNTNKKGQCNTVNGLILPQTRAKRLGSAIHPVL